MQKQLPEKPNLDQLSRQAKELEQSFAAGSPAALARVSAFLSADQLPHHLALFVVAREYGFASWARLKRRVLELRRADLPIDDFAKLFVEAATGRRVQEALAMRGERPEIAEYDLACACLCGNRSFVEGRLERTPDLLNRKVGLLKWEPILYVCYSALLHPDSPHRLKVLELGLWLLDQGADPNAHWRDEQFHCDEYALYGATGVNNCPELADALLSAGARRDDGESVYHSTELPDSRCLEVLIKHDITFEKTNGLARAIDFHAVDKVRLMLEASADPNEGLNQRTPIFIHALVRGAPVEIFEVLLEFGARDWSPAGFPSSYVAAHWINRQDVVALLEEHGFASPLSAGDQRLAAAARGESTESDAPLPAHWSEATRISAELGYLENLRGYLAAGIHPNNAGPNGDLGLHWACWQGRAEVVEFLLANGVSPHVIEPTYKATPLGWTCYASVHALGNDGRYFNPSADYPAIARLLLEAGAKLEAGMFDASDEVIAVLEEYRSRG